MFLVKSSATVCTPTARGSNDSFTSTCLQLHIMQLPANPFLGQVLPSSICTYNVFYATDTSPRALCVRSRHGLVLSGCLSVFVITQTVSRRSGLNVGAAHAYSESNFIIITTTTVIMRTVHVFLAVREIPRTLRGHVLKWRDTLKRTLSQVFKTVA